MGADVGGQGAPETWPDCRAVASTAMAELMEDDKKEEKDEEAEDVEEGFFTEDLVPKQTSAL